MGKVATLTAPTPNSLSEAVTVDGKYPYLYDKASKNWTTSKSIRNVFVMGVGAQPNNTGVGKILTNDWMNGGFNRGSIGPELGIGGMLEAASAEPTMLLKSCIGNRALGWDLLPPTSKGYVFNNFSYAAYHESPEKCAVGTRGTAACPRMGWYAGTQYDGDLVRANSVLADLSTYFPGIAHCNTAFAFLRHPALAAIVLTCHRNQRRVHENDSSVRASSQRRSRPTATRSPGSSGGKATATLVTWASPATTRRTSSR